MTWKPMERSDLEAIVVKELAECSADLKQVFAPLHERIWLHKRPLHARRG